MDRYRVKRLTDFTWDSPTSDPEPFVARAAEMFTTALRMRYPNIDAVVVMVRINNMPQLRFECTVYAEGPKEARQRASYRFEKALQTSVDIEGRKRRISPPWGDMGVEKLNG